MPNDHSNRKIVILIALGLFCWSIFLYQPTWGFDFSFFDDHRILLDQQNLYGQPHLADNLQAILFDEFPREEPLLVRDLSWLADSQLFGFNNAFGYHYSNVLYHCLNVVSIFGFLLLLTRNLIPSAVIAFLFACLAINVEPVAWIMGRKDLLTAVFLFQMLIAELMLQKSKSSVVKACWYCLSILFLILACLSKISAITYPALLFLLKLSTPYFHSKHGVIASPNFKSILKSCFLVFPHFLISLAIYIWYKGVLTDYGVFQRAQPYELIDYVKVLLLIDPLVLLKYLQLLLLPSSLSAVYTWSGLYANLTWLHWTLAITTLSSILALLIALLLRRRDLLFFVLSFFVLMIPYMNLVNFGWWYANRYLYVSSVFILTPLVLFCWEKRQQTMGMVLIFLLVLIAGINIRAQQNFLPVWRDGDALWQYQTKLSGATLQTHNNLATYYLSKVSRSPQEQRNYWLAKAEQAVNNTLIQFQPSSVEEYDPGLFQTFYNQGAILLHTQKPLSEQLAAFISAYKIRPKDVGINHALGLVYYQLARATSEDKKRKTYAHSALHHYEYFYAHDFTSRDSAKRKQHTYNLLKQQFPFLDINQNP